MVTDSAPKQHREVKDIQNKPSILEVSSGDDVLNFYTARQESQFGYVPGSNTDRMVTMSMQNYLNKSGNIKIFVAKDESGKVVAGGEMEIETTNAKKRAYLGNKFVSELYRGQGLAKDLVKKRLDAAKEAGCSEAYSLVAKNNYPAVRSITKDGFDIRSTAEQEGFKSVNQSYFAYRDLETPNKPTEIVMDRVLSAVSSRDGKGDGRSELIISFQDSNKIEQALAEGFVGKYVFDESDKIEGINSQVMYLERN